MKRVKTSRPVRTKRRETKSPQRQEDKNFYCSKPWRNLRALYLTLYPLCSDCFKHKVLTAATEVHHIVKRHVDPSRALDIHNLEGLCKPCHSRRTGRGE